MRKLLMIIPLIALMGGCSAQYWGGDTAGQRPGVVFKRGAFGDMRVEMTSDGTGKLANLSASKTKDGFSLTVTGIEISQQASPVVTAEVAKLEAIADLQQKQVEYMKQVASGVARMTEAITSAFGNPFSVAATYIGKATVAKYATTQPTSQPAE